MVASGVIFIINILGGMFDVLFAYAPENGKLPLEQADYASYGYRKCDENGNWKRIYLTTMMRNPGIYPR